MVKAKGVQLFSNSLKGRLLWASILLLPIACSVLGWSLDRAYASSLLESQKQQMTVQSYALMASAELDGDALWLPDKMPDDRLNQLSSGIFAVVFEPGNTKPLWQSISSTGFATENAPQARALARGEHEFGIHDQSEQSLFYFYFKVEWENELGNALPFIFAVYESAQSYEAQLLSYRQTLWLWLSVIGVALLSLQILILLWGLKPIDKVVKDLKAVKNGEASSLEGDYPNELQGMTSSINSLIQHEASQRERYRNTLADLAHSIKNPVAIISGALDKLRTERDAKALDDIDEQNQRINQIISYQLTRAVGQSAAPFHQAISIKPIAGKVIAVIQKVYADRQVTVRADIPEDAKFRGDQGDLMELLGNLIDNAFKYGKEQVGIKVSQEDDFLSLVIEDDGAGVSEAEQKRLLKRGERADTSLPGQGIGLAVVEDIVRNYDGELSLGSSSLGGLKLEIKF